MKRFLFPVVCIGLALTMLFATYGSANAISRPTNVLPNPTVTPLTGDLVFDTAIVGTASLPGVTYLDSGMLIPVGFPSGEKQFEGNALRISKMDFGTAKACFSFSGIDYGWGGKVGYWDGSQWNLLPTTITTPKESLISYACATVNGNGYYAFIKWVEDKSLLPTAGKCNYGIQQFFLDGEGYFVGDGFTSLFVTEGYLLTNGRVDLTGKIVTVSVRDEIPAGSISMPPITGIIQHLDGDVYFFTLPIPVYVEQSMNIQKATIVFNFGSCEDTLTVNINMPK